MLGDGLGCGSVAEGLWSMFETWIPSLAQPRALGCSLYILLEKSGRYSKSSKYFLNDYMPFVARNRSVESVEYM